MAISKATLLSTLKATIKQQNTNNAAKFVAQEAGKGLSTNDYTTTEKEKLGGVAEGAQVNVIEKVKVNGSDLAVTEKGVNIDLSAYAKSADLTTVYKYQGTVATFAELPTGLGEGDIGKVWNITNADKAHGVNAGDNLAWNGTEWDNLAGVVDLSGYVEKVEGKQLSTNDYTTEEKGQLANLVANSDEQISNEDIAGIFADNA